MVTVARCLSIAGGASAHPWIVSDVEIIGGVEFIQLSVADSGFNRFVAGTTKGLHGKSGFLAKLRELRTHATIQACCKQHDALFGATAAAAKRQRTQSREAHKRGDVPAVVQVEVPEVEHDGIIVGPMTIDMQGAIDSAATLRPRAAPEVRTYIKIGIVAGASSARAKKTHVGRCSHPMAE